MNNSNIEHLNRKHSFNNGNSFLRIKSGDNNIPLIEIQNRHANALICLQGAHLVSWIPIEQNEVIWLSTGSIFVEGKSIRGGVPVCWPWFGSYDGNTSYPAHGFARTVFWQIANTQQLSSGETQITFILDTRQLDASIQRMWPYASTVEYTLTVGRSLTLELTTQNHSEHIFTLGQALHTYFHIEDVSNSVIHGLEGKHYLDKPDRFKNKKQSGPITINQEIDRIYLDTSDDVIINDTQRKIVISKQGSQSTIVWNPWKDVADKMGDLGKEGYLKMICVESANAALDTVSIAPGNMHKLSATYKVENI